MMKLKKKIHKDLKLDYIYGLDMLKSIIYKICAKCMQAQPLMQLHSRNP